MNSAHKQWIVNILLMCGSIVVTLGGVEVFFRITRQYDTFGAATELPCMRNNSRDLSQRFTIDPDFGFRPILGSGRYSPYGTLPNDYPLEKHPGITRLLFIGDSVTARGLIVGALKRHYDDEVFEYWNAGVESFNTLQEVQFYRRYNAGIHPDHVILTFHLNDFEPIPVAFYAADKKLVVYIPHAPLKQVNRWFFEKSYVYRWIIGRTLSPQYGREKIATDIHGALRVLSDELREQHIRFSVLVLPLLEPYAQWAPHEQCSRTTILSTLESLQIAYYDLFNPFNDALEQGIPVHAAPGDTWHPSREVAEKFAEYLAEQSFLRNNTKAQP